MPVVGVAAIVKVVVVFGVGFADAEIVTATAGLFATAIETLVFDVSPKASTPVILTRYDPDAE